MSTLSYILTDCNSSVICAIPKIALWVISYGAVKCWPTCVFTLVSPSGNSGLQKRSLITSFTNWPLMYKTVSGYIYSAYIFKLSFQVWCAKIQGYSIERKHSLYPFGVFGETSFKSSHSKRCKSISAISAVMKRDIGP